MNMNTKQYDKLRAAFEASQPQLPPDFTDHVMREIDAQPATNKRWRWMAAAASLLIIIGISVSLWTTSSTEKPMLAETTQKETVIPTSVNKQEQEPDTPEKAVEEENKPKSAPATTELKPLRKLPTAIAHEPKTKEQSPAAERLNDYITLLEAEMDALDDSVRAAHLEKLIAADFRLQQLVNRIVKGDMKQVMNELKKDSTANYINF